MGLEISNFLTFPLTSSSICWWRNFFDKLQGLATIWRQSRQVSNFAYTKNRKVIPMPNFEQQIIWSDVIFEFRMTSAFIWYTYCWYVTKNDQFFIFTYWSPFWIFWPISGPFPVHFRSISGPKISSFIPCIWMPASKTTSGSLRGHFLGGVCETPPSP